MVLQRRSAFTLVELLIGVAIISTLGAILLPAIQSAREAARLTSCRSNIAQLSKGMIEHETFHGYFPSGGWSPQWLGMAERSGDSSQPGGWAFGVLPYIEEIGVRNMVANVPAGGANAAYGDLATASLPMFACPSRRGARSLPLSSTSFQGGAVTLSKATRSDYAVNSGSGGSAAAGFVGLCPRLSAYASAVTVAAKGTGKSKKVTICHAPAGDPTKGNTLNIAVSGLNGHQNHSGDMLGACDSCDDPVDAILSTPASVAQGDLWRKMSLADKLTNLGDMGIPDVIQDGVAGRMTKLQPASVYDGLSNTYLIGEKYVASDTYLSGTDQGDTAPMMAGYSSNTSRWGIVRPARDAKGVSNPRAFGSGHRGGWNVAYADGMVRTVGFDIDATLHTQLSSRNDGKGMPPKD
jgi:prepilin-type N-terminal cleavage/methylation domain-containing protein